MKCHFYPIPASVFAALLILLIPASLPKAQETAAPLEETPSISPALSAETWTLIENAPTPADLPDDAVIILMKEEHHYIEADGTATVHVHELAKVLREAGKGMGQVTLAYNRGKEKLEIEAAQTIKPGGEILNADPDLFQDLAVLGDTPLFSDLRIRQMVFPSVNVGDFLNLRYTIRLHKPILEGVYQTYFSYPLGLITQKSRLTLSLPKEMTPHFAVTLPSKREPKITEHGQRRIYQWEPEPIILSRGHEPAIPPSFDVDPFVFFSTMPAWNTLTEWYVPLFESVLEKTSDQIRSRVQSLTLEIEHDQTKVIRALFEFVSQQIDYVGITLGESAWRPYPPSYVMANSFGDCKGKAALLIAMLREAGIEAYGVLIKPTDEGRLLRDIPSLDFTHMIVAVPRGGEYLFMDPTLPMVPHDYLLAYEEGRDVIILDQTVPHFEKTPVLPVEESSKYDSEEKITINDDGSVEVRGVEAMSGLLGMEARLMIRNTNPGILRDVLESALREDYPQSTLERYAFHHADDLSRPFEITVDAKIQGAVQIAGNLLLMDQNKIMDESLPPLVSFAERIYPVFLGIKEQRNWRGTIEAPPGYKIKAVPETVVLEEPFGRYERRYETFGNDLSGHMEFTMRETVIPVDVYPRFKQFIEQISRFENEKIIFEKISPAEAPASGPGL